MELTSITQQLLQELAAVPETGETSPPNKAFLEKVISILEDKMVPPYDRVLLACVVTDLMSSIRYALPTPPPANPAPANPVLHHCVLDPQRSEIREGSIDVGGHVNVLASISSFTKYKEVYDESSFFFF